MKKRLEKILTKELGREIRLERSMEGCGDYSSNIAFILTKEKKKNPNEIAEELKVKIKSDIFSKVETKNGFLNFFISEDFLKKELSLILEKEKEYGRGKIGKRVVIDYSSPNIAKSFGIGHLRSTIIGQSLYNIYQFLGWDAIGINHLGDWGTQYGKLLYQIKKEKKDPKKLSIKELEELYVRFHKEAEEDEKIEEEGRRWFAKLEKGDKEAREIWKICREKSLEEFDEIYDELGVKIDYTTGESFYEEKLTDIIEEAKKKKVAKESKGAFIIDFDEMPPAMILKSDKSTTYLTRDLAAVKYRINKFSPDFFIYEIGVDQTLHMKQLFATVEKMGWASKDKFFHVGHGMFRLKEGKFSTRRGRTIHLREVLSLAKEKAKKIIEESLSSKDISLTEKEEIAKIVGIGAIKYNDLKRHYKRDVVFDWERVITLKGDSGPYLQYTCVRCKSILEKAKGSDTEIGNLNKEEREIVKRLTQFRETVDAAADSFSPNIIAEYAFKLAKEFNYFYDKYPILGDKKKVAITKGTYIILKKALFLLTIEVPKKM